MNAFSMPKFQAVLAFSFSQPWMLLALVLAAIPILIHFFYRRRYQEVRWAAVRFLNAAVKRNAQRHRFQQLLLLVLRTLAIALLVFAFAGPMSNANLSPAATSRPQHIVFVIDGSLSMQCREADGTRFATAIDLATQVVENSNEDDTFQVVLMAGADPQSVIAQPTSDKAEVLSALGSLTCTYRRGEPERSWPLVLELLKQTSRTTQHVVHVFSDLQAHEWRDTATDLNKQALTEIAEATALTFIDVTEGTTPNLAVHDVRIESDFVAVNEAATLRVTLQNSGDEPIEDKELRLVIDDRVVSTRNVSVEARTRSTFAFQHRFAARGQFRVSIEVDADQMPQDDQAFHIVNVYDDVPILLVNGKPSATYMGQATDFLQLSLDPKFDSPTVWKTPYRTRVVAEAELGTIDISNYSAVFLCNVRQLTKTEVGMLKAYARSGGGVVICVGDRVDLQNYNGRVFGNDGLMPGVRFQQVVGDSESPQQAFEFDAVKLDHPLLYVYRGNPGHGLEQVLTFKYIRTTVPDDSGTQTALRFRNGDPVVVETSFGAGTVCLTTVAGDDSRWSTWNTASGTYVALMNEIAQFAILERGGKQETIVGLEWRRPIVGSSADAVARLNDDVDLPSRIQRNESGSEVVIDEIPQPGFVSVSVNDEEFLLAANVDPAESDLRSVSESALRSEFLPNSAFRVRNADTFLTANSRSGQSDGNGLPFLLFAIVVGLLMAELLLASRVGVTEWLAFGIAAFAILCLAFLPSHRLAIVLFAAGGVGALMARRAWLRG